MECVSETKKWPKLGSNLISASLLVLSAQMVTNVANYGTQLLLGRLLGPEDYGAYNALMAVLVLLSIPTTTFGFLIVRNVARYDVNGQDDLIALFYKRCFVNLLILGVLLVVFVLLLQSFFHSFLHIDNKVTIFLLGPIAMVSLFIPYNLSFSQGLQDFRWLAISAATAGPFRFITSVIAAWIGWGVSGTLLATLVACILGWLLSSLPLRTYWRPVVRSFTVHQRPILWGDILPVFISTISFVVLTQSDVIVVKHLFTAQQSGFYASAALLGKMVLYIPGAVIVSFVPMVASQRHPNKLWHLLKKALILTAFLSGTSAFFLWLMPEWILYIFFGNKYLPAAPLLKYFGISMLFMAFILVIKAYYIATSAYRFSYVMLFGSIGMLIIISFYASEPMDVVMWMGIFGFVIALIGLVMEYFSLLRSMPTSEGVGS